MELVKALQAESNRGTVNVDLMFVNKVHWKEDASCKPQSHVNFEVWLVSSDCAGTSARSRIATAV